MAKFIYYYITDVTDDWDSRDIIDGVEAENKEEAVQKIKPSRRDENPIENIHTPEEFWEIIRN